jgi:hypothetical protein
MKIWGGTETEHNMRFVISRMMSEGAERWKVGLWRRIEGEKTVSRNASKRYRSTPKMHVKLVTDKLNCNLGRVSVSLPHRFEDL